jgi:hypothetical protein
MNMAFFGESYRAAPGLRVLKRKRRRLLAAVSGEQANPSL